MSDVTIHQALHGYRRGHELLSSSIRLPPVAADVVTRLSDLSGSLIAGWEFTPYLTGYPVVDTGFYAIARTWEDKTATRAGCVLTHTLLVPIETWRRCTSPRQLSDLFALPENLRDEDRFKKPLRLDLKKALDRPIQLPRGMAVDFVRKYYAEGQLPLVWFDCLEPEETAWAIIKALWPTLRERFSWCTASLQPRAIESRMLDLQFAPSEAYPRFHKIPRESFISADSAKKAGSGEPWCVPCANWIFMAERPGPVDAEILAFGPYLRGDATLMRNLFLARELSERASLSPTAGVGLLDVAEALAPGPEAAVSYKSAAARNAINAAVAASPDEALKCLFLIGERLNNAAFQGVVEEFGAILSSKVEKMSARHVREAMMMPERVVSRTGVTTSPYFQGLVLGVTRCASDSPADLTCLSEFDKTTPYLIAASPAIASGYLRGIHLEERGQADREALVGWVAGFGDSMLRASVREELLPEIHDDRDTHLTEELLRDLPPDQAGSALEALANGTKDFSSQRVLAAIQELIAEPYPKAVREWALTRKKWSEGTISLIAGTFSTDQEGLGQVVAFNPRDERQRAELLAAFLENCTSVRAPGWFKDAARQSSDWLTPILMLGDQIPDTAVKVLDKLLPELRDVPVAVHSSMLDVMPTLSRYSFWGALVDIALRGAVTAFVDGVLEDEKCRAWFSYPWASNWVADISRGDLSAVLIQPVTDQGRRERAFRWLALAPSSLYERQPGFVPGLFWELVSERRFGWTPEMGAAWGETLHRVQEATPRSMSLRMCADVLLYGFDTTHEPVGAAVAASFYPVYKVVCDSNWTPPEVSKLFGWFEWDKAKELRKGLVRAFVDSCWNPADLALAAREDEALLRKLVKRTYRTENGSGYVIAMLNDLALRPESIAGKTASIVRELASDPEFHEPWD